jgi:hypothetical protein
VREAMLPSSNQSEGRTKTLYVTIADITLGVTCDAPELNLRADRSAERFLVGQADPDVCIRVTLADLSGETRGIKIFDSGSLWQLYHEGGGYLFRFVASALTSIPYKVALFHPDFRSGEVSLHRDLFESGHPVYPLEYPLDELVIMHVLARGTGVAVHACGLIDSLGNGQLFVGQSGAGKTTMARLWQKEAGVTILSDDRIILRNVDKRLYMYGTPWHGEAELACPAHAPLTQIFFLRHGQTNELVPMTEAKAVAHLFVCSFPLFHSPDALNFTLGFMAEVTATVPCHELRFVPDESVVEFLRRQSVRRL